MSPFSTLDPSSEAKDRLQRMHGRRVGSGAWQTVLARPCPRHHAGPHEPCWTVEGGFRAVCGERIRRGRYRTDGYGRRRR